ncbi:acetyl-CoA synthetase-like protein [Cadophora sp. DSE1049]|nr:acetyl-CoA synthetase-like protein [Cadophora sp. DSE1049]
MPAALEYRSPYSIDIPAVDIPTFIFSSGTPESRRSPQYFDAEQPSRNFSLAQAEVWVKQVAKGMQDLGLKPDDKVLLFCGNMLHFPVLLWGTIAAGCVFTACTPSASLQELVYQLKDSDVKLLLTSKPSSKTAIAAAKEVSIPLSRVFIFDDISENSLPSQNSGLRPWTHFWASGSSCMNWHWKRITSKGEAESTTAIINYSSGTTGLPKGVEISHFCLVANAEQVIQKKRLIADTPEGQARNARLELSGDRWLAPIPMYHAYGQNYFCINAARIGAKVFVMKSFAIDKYLLFMDIYRITYMASVPTIMVMLSKDPTATAYNFRNVEQVVTGSAPLGKDIGDIIEQRLLRPGVQVKQGWGMTECTCSATGFAPDDVDDGSSVGWLNANVSARIVPVGGREFNSDAANGKVVGELWISGPNVMKGYYKEEQTKETIVYVDGKRWLRTGDVGFFDEFERLHIVDRMKELIKVKGLQVAPAELEAVLLLHPGVQDAAVAAVQVNGNEYPKGYVVRKSKDVTASELEKWVQERCSSYKWLTGGVAFIDVVPRTASGKVKRRDLPQSKLVSKESKI